MESSDEHAKKESSPMAVTESGMSIARSDEQAAKEAVPRVVTELGMEMDSREEQPEKVLLAMLVKLLWWGSTTLRSAAHCLKALARSHVTTSRTRSARIGCNDDEVARGAKFKYVGRRVLSFILLC